MTDLRGRYRILNEAFLREKANRTDDERHKLYEAMLANRSYDAYSAAVGQKEIWREGYKRTQLRVETKFFMPAATVLV